MTRWALACGFAGAAALLIACGEQTVPQAPTALATLPSPSPSAPAMPTPDPTLKEMTGTAPSPTQIADASPSPTFTPTPTATRTPTAQEAAHEAIAALVPWFPEPTGPAGEEAARLLSELWLKDDSLGRAVASLPWVASAPVGEMTPAVLLAMRDIADVDRELVSRVLGYRWLATGVLSDDQRLAIEALRDIVRADPKLGQQAVALPWLADELSGIEGDTLNALREAVLIDLDFAKLVVKFYPGSRTT